MICFSAPRGEEEVIEEEHQEDEEGRLLVEGGEPERDAGEGERAEPPPVDLGEVEEEAQEAEEDGADVDDRDAGVDEEERLEGQEERGIEREALVPGHRPAQAEEDGDAHGPEDHLEDPPAEGVVPEDRDAGGDERLGEERVLQVAVVRVGCALLPGEHRLRGGDVVDLVHDAAVDLLVRRVAGQVLVAEGDMSGEGFGWRDQLPAS